MWLMHYLVQLYKVVECNRKVSYNRVCMCITVPYNERQWTLKEQLGIEGRSNK